MHGFYQGGKVVEQRRTGRFASVLSPLGEGILKFRNQKDEQLNICIPLQALLVFSKRSLHSKWTI